MLNTVRAIVRGKKIELLEDIDIQDGTKVLVTLLNDGENHQFWQKVGAISLDSIWNNQEDDIYEKLL